MSLYVAGRLTCLKFNPDQSITRNVVMAEPIIVFSPTTSVIKFECFERTKEALCSICNGLFTFSPSVIVMEAHLYRLNKTSTAQRWVFEFSLFSALSLQNMKRLIQLTLFCHKTKTYKIMKWIVCTQNLKFCCSFSSSLLSAQDERREEKNAKCTTTFVKRSFLLNNRTEFEFVKYSLVDSKNGNVKKKLVEKKNTTTTTIYRYRSKVWLN